MVELAKEWRLSGERTESITTGHHPSVREQVGTQTLYLRSALSSEQRTRAFLIASWRTFAYSIILFPFDKESMTLFDINICLQGSISTFRRHCLLFHKNSTSHFCRIKLDSANLQEMFVLIFFEKRLEEEACAGSLLLGVRFVFALATIPLELYSL